MNRSTFNALKVILFYLAFPHIPSKIKYKDLYQDWHVKDSFKTISRRNEISNKFVKNIMISNLSQFSD